MVVNFNQGTIIANQLNIDVVAQDPGDVLIEIFPTQGPSSGLDMRIPVKAFKCDKTVDVTVLYGVGSHEGYQKTYGKVGYKGSFTINSWIDQTEKAKLERILYSQNNFEGTPYEFNVVVYDRGGGAIATVSYCTLNGDGIDIGEPGNPIATTFEFTALRRTPK